MSAEDDIQQALRRSPIRTEPLYPSARTVRERAKHDVPLYVAPPIIYHTDKILMWVVICCIFAVAAVLFGLLAIKH